MPLIAYKGNAYRLGRLKYKNLLVAIKLGVPKDVVIERLCSAPLGPIEDITHISQQDAKNLLIMEKAEQRNIRRKYRKSE